jgi:hypothetical protein
MTAVAVSESCSSNVIWFGEDRLRIGVDRDWRSSAMKFDAPRRSSVVLAFIALLWGLGAEEGRAVAQAPDSGAVSKERDRAERLEEMKQIASSFHASTIDGTKQTPAMLAGEPLYRWNDPTREFSDGTLWFWRSSGRPIGVVAIELYPYDRAFGIVWALEFTSLTTRAIEVEGGEHFNRRYADLHPPRPDGRLRWAPKEGGVTFRRVPDAPRAGATEAERLRQMKDMVKRFSAREVFRSQEYKLRLIARPIDRYADSSARVVDGEVFLFGNGTNPEVLLMIQLDGVIEGSDIWSYAAAPLARAELTLSLDGNDVWTFKSKDVPSPEENYFLARRPRNQSLTGGGAQKTPIKNRE